MNKRLRLAAIVTGALIVAAACGAGTTGTPAGATGTPGATGTAAGSVTPSPTIQTLTCKSGTGSTPAGATPLEYKGTITFWNTMRDFEGAEVQKLVDAWCAAHPGITVKMDLVPFAGADVQYATAAKAKTAPDLFRSDVGWVSGFADAGYLLDLTGKVNNITDFLEAPLLTGTYQTKIYGAPSVTDALGLQCNKQLLTQAGLSAAPTSWDQLVEAGKKVTDLAAKKYGFYMRGDSYWVQPFTWGWGGTLFTITPDGKVGQININSPESVAGWTYVKDKILGVVAPKTWDFVSDYDNMDAGFKAGTTMCILQGPWQVADIVKGSAFSDKSNLVIAPVPEGLPGKTGSPVGGHDYVVYALVGQDAAKQAAVLDLLNYIDSTESQVALAKSLGLLPTRKSAYENADVKADPLISAWSAVLAKATNRAGVPGAQNIYKPYSDNWQLFVNDTSTDTAATAKKYLDVIANKWQTEVFQGQMAQ